MKGVEVIFHSELPDAEVKRRKYAFPEERRFPLTDRAHVMSAIRFFNYAKPDEEAHLAKTILKRMRELGITDVNVGESNRFKGYYERSMRHGDMMTTKPIFSDDSGEVIAHYGVMGMKWGVRHDRERTGRKVASTVSNYRSKASDIRAKAYRTDTTRTGKSRTASYSKYMSKANKYVKKANRSMMNPLQSPYRRAVNQRKALKYQQKAAGLSGSVSKVAKLNAKASKLEYKADKLEKAYSKQLSKLDAKELKRAEAQVQDVFSNSAKKED